MTPLLFSILAVLAGLLILAWSADRFVDGSVAVARHFRLSPLLIGMVIVGFGTSAPEMAVSALSSVQGNPGIALGNAYGSNIANIALILGLTAVISPIAVRSGILKKELPVLVAATALAAVQLFDGVISRTDAVVLLGVFGGLLFWSIRQGLRNAPADALGREMQRELEARDQPPLGRAGFRLAAGLVLLIASSRMLVWGAVNIARGFGVDDLIIGLTIVAVGTSLPELASSISAARKHENDIALGNVLGSNLFNTLAVVGIAGAIHPMRVPSDVFFRDLPAMGILSLSIFAVGYGFRGRPGRINRLEGGVLLLCYIGYTIVLVAGTFLNNA